MNIDRAEYTPAAKSKCFVDPGMPEFSSQRPRQASANRASGQNPKTGVLTLLIPESESPRTDNTRRRQRALMMARMVEIECERKDGIKFVVHIDEHRYKLIFSKVFLALNNTNPDYDGEIELENFDTEEEAAVAHAIAKR